jgi:hypothetical protein
MRLVVCTLVSLTAGCSDDDAPTDTPTTLTVDLTAPANGAQISGEVLLLATAPEAEAVAFLVDGNEVGTDASTPFAFSWNSETVSNGGRRITARASRGSDRAEDSVDIVVNNAGGGVGVSVSPPTATVAVGQTRTFVATVVGATNTAVVWSVDEGAARGTINASGLYTAPAQLPTPPTATVRATSVEDPAKSATAVVTLTGSGGGGGGGTLTAADLSAIRAAYFGGFETRAFINDGNDFAASSFFLASCANGNKGTTAGTLTETAPGSGEFNYTSQPTDRLRVVFGNGNNLDIFFESISGDLGGFECDGATSFLGAHDDFRYRVVSTGLDVTISSAVIPQDDFEKSVSQSIQGTITLNGETWAVQGQMTGTFIFVISESASNTHDRLHIETTLSAGAKQAEISHDFEFKNDFFSQSGDSFTEQTDSFASTATPDNGATLFQWQNVVYHFFDSDDIQPVHEGEGTLLRNDVPIGNLVVNSATGQAGIQIVGGETIPL